MAAAVALASELNYSLNLTIQASVLKVRRGASATTTASTRASDLVKSARASAKAQLKAEGKPKAKDGEVEIVAAAGQLEDTYEE